MHRQTHATYLFMSHETHRQTHGHVGSSKHCTSVFPLFRHSFILSVQVIRTQSSQRHPIPPFPFKCWWMNDLLLLYYLAYAERKHKLDTLKSCFVFAIVFFPRDERDRHIWQVGTFKTGLLEKIAGLPRKRLK